jgi:hypothetical protein
LLREVVVIRSAVPWLSFGWRVFLSLFEFGFLLLLVS